MRRPSVLALSTEDGGEEKGSKDGEREKKGEGWGERGKCHEKTLLMMSKNEVKVKRNACGETGH